MPPTLSDPIRPLKPASHTQSSSGPGPSRIPSTSSATTTTTSDARKDKRAKKRKRSSIGALSQLSPVRLPVLPEAAAPVVRAAHTAPVRSPGIGMKGEGKKARRKRQKLSLGAEASITGSAPPARHKGLADVDENSRDTAIPVKSPLNEAKEPTETKDQILPRLLADANHGSKKAPVSHDKPHRQPDPSRATAQATSSKIKDERILKLQQQLVDAESEVRKEREAWEKEKAELVGKVEELEKVARTSAEEKDGLVAEKDQIIDANNMTLDVLREAVACGVCLETLNDPHIVWFRTPVAFMHEIPDTMGETVPIDRDVSYRTKVCHVCRVAILRRPSRMYHIDSILSPLGINPNLPTASQEEREVTDPWHNIFPPERDTYRVQDAADGVDRCPECYGEVEDDMCPSCGIEFSEQEEDGDWEDDGDMDDSELATQYDDDEARDVIGVPRLGYGGAVGAAVNRRRHGGPLGDSDDEEDIDSVDGDLPGFVVPDDDDVDDDLGARARAAVRADAGIRRQERIEERRQRRREENQDARRANRFANLIFDLEVSEGDDDDYDEEEEEEDDHSDEDGSNSDESSDSVVAVNPPAPAPRRRTEITGLSSRDRVRLRLQGELDDGMEDEEEDADLALEEDESYEDSFIDDDEEEDGEDVESGEGSDDVPRRQWGEASEEEEDKYDEEAIKEDDSLGERGEVDSEVGSIESERFDQDRVREQRLRRFAPAPASAAGPATAPTVNRAAAARSPSPSPVPVPRTRHSRSNRRRIVNPDSESE